MPKTQETTMRVVCDNHHCRAVVSWVVETLAPDGSNVPKEFFSIIGLRRYWTDPKSGDPCGEYTFCSSRCLKVWLRDFRDSVPEKAERPNNVVRFPDGSPSSVEPEVVA